MKDESLKQKEEMVTCLQQELVKVRLREAENDALIRDLRARINELEEVCVNVVCMVVVQCTFFQE